MNKTLQIHDTGFRIHDKENTIRGGLKGDIVHRASCIVHYSCLLSTVFCLLLFGCGGSTAPTLSSIHTSAIEYNRNGMKAMEKGDYDKALDYYMEALKINQSIEHTEGIAINLINIGVIYQLKGRISEAHKFIDAVIFIQDVSDDIRSEAAFEKAKLYLKEKDIQKSKEWVSRSLSLNKGSREGSRWNLLGRAAFVEGRYDEGLIFADTALVLNKKNNQRTEEANSLRLLAEINAQKGRYEESRMYYMNALELDKVQGNSKKIVHDLRGLGELALRQGSLQDALSFYKRAYDVSLNADDKDGALEALGSIVDVYRRLGDEKNAGEIELHREEILKGK
ncbi:MAG: tetratricopeptide repeat protein [Nitrospirae bacterium]|nr:tetratricopeptide repeat protein [Nitrospirota bacterium]